MQLTKHTDLSLRVLMYLAIHPEKKVTISEIALHYGASKNHLVKVVHRMVSLGYILSTQGRGGGLSLGIDIHEISIGEVMRNMESTLDVVDCQSDQCPLIPACRLKSALNKATQAFLDVLDNYTIADLVINKSHLLRLLELP